MPDFLNPLQEIIEAQREANRLQEEAAEQVRMLEDEALERAEVGPPVAVFPPPAGGVGLEEDLHFHRFGAIEVPPQLHPAEQQFRQMFPQLPVYQEWEGGIITDYCYMQGFVWLDGAWRDPVEGALIKGLDGVNRFLRVDQERLRHDVPKRRIVEPPALLPEYELCEEDMPRKLPAFKVPYETLEEASLRLRNTVIMVKADPVFVFEVGGEHKNLEILVENSEGKRSRLPLAKVPDLRSPAPGYIEYNGGVVWLSRVPDRIFQQGLNSKNGLLREVGKKQIFEVNPRALLPGLKNRKPQRWNERLKTQIDTDEAPNRSVRLSDHVAAYRSKKGQISVEYRGRYLGVLENRGVTCGDPGDMVPTWIMADLAEVGLELRA